MRFFCFAPCVLKLVELLEETFALLFGERGDLSAIDLEQKFLRRIVLRRGPFFPQSVSPAHGSRLMRAASSSSDKPRRGTDKSRHLACGALSRALCLQHSLDGT
jgi:hypothetical protein